jgi:hypothetical protein
MGNAPSIWADARHRGKALGVRLLACLALTVVAGAAGATTALAKENLVYHGGPVLHQITTHVIYLSTNQLVFTPTYEEQITGFLKDVATDSGSNSAYAQESHVPGVPTGRSTNPYSVATQYYQQDGNVINPIEYNQVFGGESDETALFGSGCRVPAGALVCFNEGQLEGAMESILSHHPSWHRGFFDVYFIVLPPGVQICEGGENECGPYAGGSKGKMCGYHTSQDTGGGGNNTIIWAALAYGGPCLTNFPEPNGTAADHTISNLSHEEIEAITSPQTPDHFLFFSLGNHPGWQTEGNEEIGDQCVEKGPTISENHLGEYDVLINHHPYEIQPEWSNEAGRCAMNMAKPPFAGFDRRPGHVLENREYFSDANSENIGGYIIKYKWEWGDGSEATVVTAPNAGEAASPIAHHVFFETGPHTIKLTVTDDAGLQTTVSEVVNMEPARPQVSLTVPNTDYNEGEGNWTAKLTFADSGVLIGSFLKVFLPNETCEGAVNAHGELTQSTATCTLAAGQPALLPPGSYLAAAEMEELPGIAPSAFFLTSFTVSPEQTRLTFFGPPNVADGQPVTLGVLLTTDEATELVSPVTHTAEITLGGSPGYAPQTCTGEVALAGVNSILVCTIKEVNQDPSLKTLPVNARFAGDGYYEPTEMAPAAVTQSLSTTMSLQASPNPVTFGERLALKATVAAHAPATTTPTGTVTFFDNGNQIGEPQKLSGGSAGLTVSSLPPGGHTLTANYSGDGNFPPNSAGTSSEVQVRCTRTLEGSHPLEAVVATIGATCVRNATVLSVTGLTGGSVLVENTTVIGAINTNEAGAIRVCGSSTGLLAANVLTASSGFVEIGDGGDENAPACAGNSFNGGLAELHVERSHGGVEVGGNKVGALYLTNSTGEGPAPENEQPEIEANEVAGVLACVNNNPAPTNDGRANKLAFGGFGQCSGF